VKNKFLSASLLLLLACLAGFYGWGITCQRMIAAVSIVSNLDIGSRNQPGGGFWCSSSSCNGRLVVHRASFDPSTVVFSRRSSFLDNEAIFPAALVRHRGPGRHV